MRHRCGAEPAGHLEYGRGNREPSLPQNGPQEIAPGKQAPASQEVGIKKSGEGTQTGGTSALPHHLPASGYAPKAYDPTGRQLWNLRGRRPASGGTAEKPTPGSLLL